MLVTLLAVLLSIKKNILLPTYTCNGWDGQLPLARLNIVVPVWDWLYYVNMGYSHIQDHGTDLSPILTVASVWNAGETGDIYSLYVIIITLWFVPEEDYLLERQWELRVVTADVLYRWPRLWKTPQGLWPCPPGCTFSWQFQSHPRKFMQRKNVMPRTWRA